MATHWAKVIVGIKDRDVPKSKKEIFCIITPVSTFIFTAIIITKKKISFNNLFRGRIGGNGWWIRVAWVGGVRGGKI